jgi:hypothetical protein
MMCLRTFQMDEQTSRRAPQDVIEALDSSLRDIAEGNVHNALSVQVEARRLLADHNRDQLTAPRSPPGKRVRRTRTA